MRSAKGTGRIIGMLLVLQLAGLIVPFVLLLPLTMGPQNYLAHAVESSLRWSARQGGGRILPSSLP